MSENRFGNKLLLLRCIHCRCCKHRLTWVLEEVAMGPWIPPLGPCLLHPLQKSKNKAFSSKRVMLGQAWWPIKPSFPWFLGFIKENLQIYQGFSAPAEPTNSFENTKISDFSSRPWRNLPRPHG